MNISNDNKGATRNMDDFIDRYVSNMIDDVDEEVGVSSQRSAIMNLTIGQLVDKEDIDSALQSIIFHSKITLSDILNSKQLITQLIVTAIDIHLTKCDKYVSYNGNFVQ